MCLSPEIAAKLLESIALPEDIDELVDDVEYESEEEQTQRPGKSYSMGIVSHVAYLIGVPQEYFGKNHTQFQKSVFDVLEKNDDAHCVRALCSIRNAIIRQPGTIVKKMRDEIRNLDSIPELIDPALFEYLESKKIRIVTGSQLKEIHEYLIIINNHITNKLANVVKLFPAWVEKEYIRDMIAMPGGSKKEKVMAACKKMQENFGSYPFNCYINWPIERAEAFVENPEYYLEPVHTGNVIQNDKKFLVLLYKIHGAEFQDLHRVTDASDETRLRLTDYMQLHDRVVMLVDCENSDPYKLCAVLDALRDSWSRDILDNPEGQHMGVIEKIVLFDDSHTVDAWDIITDHISVPIEHQEIERVLGKKSLVDIAMTAGACREHYVNGADSFIIASSDSDYWGLMRAMPDASFLVLAENEKFSTDAEKFYSAHGVPTCLMDDFAGSLTNIKEAALRHSLEKRINNLMMINLDEILQDIYPELRLEMSAREKDNFRSTICKELRLNISGNGAITVKIAA